MVEILLQNVFLIVMSVKSINILESTEQEVLKRLMV